MGWNVKTIKDIMLTYKREEQTTMHDFSIIESSDYSKGRYVLIMDGGIIDYADSVAVLAACVHQLIRMPHAPQIRR